MTHPLVLLCSCGCTHTGTTFTRRIQIQIMAHRQKVELKLGVSLRECTKEIVKNSINEICSETVGPGLAADILNNKLTFKYDLIAGCHALA